MKDRRREFVERYKHLVIPQGVKLIRADVDFNEFGEDHSVWEQISYYCGDLNVYSLEFPRFNVDFYLYNKKMELGGQAVRLFGREPIPGNTLSRKAYVYFHEPIDVLWTSAGSDQRLIYPSSESNVVFQFESAHGVTEYDTHYGQGKFLPRGDRWKGNTPKHLVFSVGGRNLDTPHSAVSEVRIDLKKLGQGYVDAFMRHVGMDNPTS